MLRAVLLVMGGTLASRVLGLVRQAVFNALYPDALKDAFNVAYRVPNLLRELLAEGAVQNALIPLLKSLPPEEAQAFARRFAAFLFGVNLLVLGLGYLLAPWVAGLLVAEESHLRAPEAFQEVVYLTRLLLPFLLGISMAALFSALLQAEERFLPYALGPVAFNLVAILLMALYPGDPTALGLSVSLGGLIQALVQLPFLRGFPQKPVAQGVQEEDEGAGRDRLPHPAEGVKPAEEEGVHPPGEDGEPQGGEHLGAVGPVLRGEGAEEAEEEDHHEGGEAREEAAEKGQDQGQALKGAPEKAP